MGTIFGILLTIAVIGIIARDSKIRKEKKWDRFLQKLEEPIPGIDYETVLNRLAEKLRDWRPPKNVFYWNSAGIYPKNTPPEQIFKCKITPQGVPPTGFH